MSRTVPIGELDERAATRPPVWWGAFWGLVVVGTMVATLVSSFLYLRYAAADWPPPGTDAPPLGLAAAATALALGGTVPVGLAVRAARAGRRGAAIALAGLTSALGAGAIALGAAAALGAGVAHDEHAFGSLFHTAHALHGLLALSAVVLVASGAEALRRWGRVMPLRLGALVWNASAALWLLSAATFYLGLRVL